MARAKKTSKRKTAKKAPRKRGLIDAQAMHKKSPKTFEVPKQKRIDAIGEGYFVKVAAKVGGKGNPSAERFWVRVTDRKGQRLSGVIDNDLGWTNVHGHKAGDKITFSTKNVYDVLPPRRRNPADSYHDEPPTAPVDTLVWREEVIDLTADAQRDPQLRMLLGGRTLALLERLQTAPRREKFYRRVPLSSVDPVPVEGNEDWDHIDRRTGQPIWPRRGGAWVVAQPHPQGAFTLGEMVELEARLWGAGEAFAQAAEQGFLDERQRRYAVDVVEAADDLSMRLAIMRWKPDEETREKVLREVLAMIVNDEPEPPRPTLRVVKNRLMR